MTHTPSQPGDPWPWYCPNCIPQHTFLPQETKIKTLTVEVPVPDVFAQYKEYTLVKVYQNGDVIIKTKQKDEIDE